MVEERRSCQERGRGVPQASRLGGAGALCKRDERGVCDRGVSVVRSKNAPQRKTVRKLTCEEPQSCPRHSPTRGRYLFVIFCYATGN